MRRLAILFSVLCTFASIAFAGSLLVGSGIGSMTAPTSSTSGYALPNPTQLRGVSVTAVDVRDGSVGDGLDSVLTVKAYAWCYNSSNAVRGANGWTRLPALDVYATISDAGTGIAGDGLHNALTGSTMLSTQVGVPCTRIAYTSELNASWDAGTLVHTLTVNELN